MASDDADFASYLTARWPTLVRTAVMLGRGRPEAEELVRAALTRCRAEWREVREGDDADAHVYGALLDRHRHLPVADAPEPVAPDPSDDELLRDALAVRLRELPAEQTDPLVLRAVADLTDAQIGEVLDLATDSVRRRASDAAERLDVATLPGPGRESAEALLHRAALSIEPGGAPVEEVLTRARARRRRRLQLAAAGATGVAVIGLATWIVVRPPAEETLPPPDVTRAPNPVDVAWYADGVLHLDQVRVELPPLTDLAELNGGAVYGDEEGVVAFVAADGDRRQLGRKDPDVPLVASADDGWAAWVEPDGDLVAYDVGAGEELGYLPVDDGTRPVAIDQQQVFFDTEDDSFAWQPGVGAPESIGRPGLVDVESATRVYQVGDQIEMEQGFFNVSFARPGHGALLSPGGTYALTRPPTETSEPGAAYQWLLYDSRSGKTEPMGLEPGERVLDATFGDNSRLVYLIAPASGSPDDALLVLRTCDLGIEVECSDVSPVVQSDERPLLAH